MENEFDYEDSPSAVEIFEQRIRDLSKFEGENPIEGVSYEEGKLDFYRKTLELNRYLLKIATQGYTRH